MNSPPYKTLIALAAPFVAGAVSYAGIKMNFTNNRVFDGLIVLPLLFGAYFGISAFRARDSHFAMRLLALLAVIVCVLYGAVMLFITIFGLA